MTTLKLDSKLGGNAVIALHPLIGKLYHDLGHRVMAVVELASVERTEPADDEERAASVKIAVKAVEVGYGEQEHALRRAMRALYVHRSATGTIDEHFDIHLNKEVIEDLADTVSLAETARLRAALDRVAGELHRIGMADLPIERMKEQIRNVRTVAVRSLEWAEDRAGGD